MTDPVAEAAKQLAQAEPSLIDEIKAGIYTLEEKVEHLIHPEQSAEVAQAGESSAAIASSPSPNFAPIQTELSTAPVQTLVSTALNSTEQSAMPSLTAQASGEAVEAGNAPAAAEVSATAPATADAPAVADTGEQQSASETLSVSTIAENSSSSASQPSTEVTTEHPHTTILRHMTQTLRRKWNMFDGELEAIIKDAESHL
jgi:hypothetical protein